MATTKTQGLAFPLELTSGRHTIASEEDLIQSSIRAIIAWPLYTREYIDDFGSRIHEALEDQNDDILLTLLKRFVISAITEWELRIELTKLTFTRTTNQGLAVDISYQVKDINIEDTLRYDFYTN